MALTAGAEISEKAFSGNGGLASCTGVTAGSLSGRVCAKFHDPRPLPGCRIQHTLTMGYASAALLSEGTHEVDMEAQTPHCQCSEETEEQKRAHILRIIDDFKGQEGSLIQILHLVQGYYGCLPLEIQQLVAERLDIPLSEVYGVSSFYSYFTTKPRGEYTLRVCMGTACYVRGGAEILKRLTQLLGIAVGETTKDGKFTLEVTRCIGACGLAPAMVINETIYRQVAPDRLNRILARCD